MVAAACTNDKTIHAFGVEIFLYVATWSFKCLKDDNTGILTSAVLFTKM